MALQLLTNSRRNSFGTCHRKHQYEYEMCLRPVSDGSALRVGTLTHACLEHWWALASGTPAERIVEIESTLQAHLESGMDAYEVALVRGMMIGYEKRWDGVNEIQTLAIEVQYTAPLMNPETGAPSRTFELAGKLDVLAVIDGRTVIVEHKTTSEDIGADARYWTKLSIDGQVSGYYIGAQALGYAVDGCVYDVIRKPGLRPSQIPELDENGLKIVMDANGNRVMNKDGKTFRQTASTADGFVVQSRLETPDEYSTRVAADVVGNNEKYFGRREVPRLDSDLMEYLEDMWATAREIADAQRTTRWPRNPRSCDIYAGCPYFDVCAGMASIDDTTRFSQASAHRELTVEGF